MLSKISSNNINTNTNQSMVQSKTSQADELISICANIKKYAKQEVFEKSFGDIYNEADIYKENGDKGKDGKVSTLELLTWLKNNINKGCLVFPELEIFNLPSDITDFSDEQIKTRLLRKNVTALFFYVEFYSASTAISSISVFVSLIGGV